MQDLFNLLDNETSYVGKINTSDVSVPISHAAIGNESYIDVYNTSTAGGYDITGTSVPGVLDSDDYEGPTGFASSIASTPRYDRNTVPEIHTGDITKETISEYRDKFAKEWGIPPAIAKAIIHQESGGNPKAMSKVGATGVMQLMPTTAKALGVKNITDPAQNIWGGMKYLAQQYKQFGNWALALAAYNAGPGAVRKHKGIPPFKETQNYVKNIMAMAGFAYKDTFPITHSLDSIKNQRKFMNEDTGMLSVNGINNFVYELNNAACYKNKVDHVITNRPELLENKSQYADFKKYRDMKAADGKPLFVKGDFNGFKVMLKNDARTKDGILNDASYEAIADDVVRKQTNYLPENNRDQIEALLHTFGTRYNRNINYDGSENPTQFGLANLTSEEYESYGIRLYLQQNPILQARVLNQEFQRALDILKTEGKAIYALAGGEVTDEEGNIRTWSELKKDKEAFMKKWFIQPSQDSKKRDRINGIVSKYNQAYNLMKGL